jgi:4-hydroxy-tetrahydrodipicolinate reductase
MNIALVGTGQMGRTIADLAPEHDHRIVATFDSARPLADASPDALADADVAIDFSLPSVALDHIDRYCQWQQPAVVGTTGWYNALDDVAQQVRAHEATLLYAANFSLGIALLRRAVQAAAPLLNALPDFDAFVHETHHTKKVDSPSGTARVLGEDLLNALDRKTHLEIETQHERIDPEALHVTATRAGHVFGEHTVGLDGPHDHLTLSHRAKGRAGFAVGAVRAAEWLRGRTGLFTLDDVLDDWIGGNA